ncbi:MAG: purine-nucleoside phosphorylase [Desulfarculales bacterium]|jgi:purine-nucleoside phosphorylase|nr:purine-nucleoside phosphorylase [Desulfarculales bacterium]
MWSDFHERVQVCLNDLKSRVPAAFTPRAVLTLGTGLEGLKERLTGAVSISCNDIDIFSPVASPVHEKSLCLGYWGNVPTAILVGRMHLYEGYHPSQIAMPVNLLASWGADTFIFSNAAGGLDLSMRPGQVMLITDHINLTGHNPLTGSHIPSWGPRFTDMSQTYDRKLLTLARQAAARAGITCHEGVYAGLSGPSLETPAETRMLQMLGAKAVGMSTVLEVIAARARGARVMAVSAITNVNNPENMRPVSLDEIIAVAGRAGQDIERIVSAVLTDAYS